MKVQQDQAAAQKLQYDQRSAAEAQRYDETVARYEENQKIQADQFQKKYDQQTAAAAQAAQEFQTYQTNAEKRFQDQAKQYDARR